jgi:hypothetical protein
MKVKCNHRMCMFTCMYVLIDKKLFTKHYLYVCMYVCMYVGDHEEVIRVEAMKMLQVEDEVHPTFLDNRLVQGFEEASEFQVKVFGRSAATELELQSIHLNVCYCMYA